MNLETNPGGGVLRFDGRKLRAFRESQGLRQRDVAERIGIGGDQASKVSYWERNIFKPSVSTWERLAAALEVKPGDLLARTPPKRQKPNRASDAPGFDGTVLRRLRVQRKWTQAQLAERLGVHDESHVSQWERGFKTPSQASLTKLAQLLRVPETVLLGQEGAPIDAKSDYARGYNKGFNAGVAWAIERGLTGDA